MKAIVITDIGPVNEEREILKEVDIPIPEPDDGMIRIKYLPDRHGNQLSTHLGILNPADVL